MFRPVLPLTKSALNSIHSSFRPHTHNPKLISIKSCVYIPAANMSAKKKRPEPKDFATVFQTQFGDLKEEFIDTHCHIDAIINRLNQAEKNKAQPATSDECCGTTKAPTAASGSWDWEKFHKTSMLGNQPACLTVCCDIESYDPIMSLLNNDTTDKLRGAFGIHPHEAKHWSPEVEKRLIDAMTHPKVIAWGECGLDFYYNNSPRDVQIQCFIRQIQLAVEHNKPLVVHSRDAEVETLEVMMKHLPKEHKVHLHCCTSSANMVKPLLDQFPNLYVGFTGCITFSTADENRATVASVPMNRLLLETDGPYMAPVPFRGQIAHPGMIPFIAEVMAKVHNVDLRTLLLQVRENTRALYGM